MTVSLVTGGTAGIGAAFAHRLAAEGCDLVLVARDADRLDSFCAELTRRYGVRAEALPADLATDDGVSAVQRRLEDPRQPVDLLVNNAGFGVRGSFVQIPMDEHERMVRVLCLALLRLTHAALGVMVSRGSGGVLNVSSVAGYSKDSGTYSASKAFVTALSESLAVELVDTGVHVSAVCPGFVRTEFHQRAGIDMTKVPKPLYLDADAVVRDALRAHRAGKVVTVPSPQYKAIVLGTKLVPRSVTTRIAKQVRRRQGGRT